MATTVYATPFGVGELVGRSSSPYRSLEIKLTWGTVFVPTGSSNQTAFAALVPPRGLTHPTSQAHPQYARSVPHAVHLGHTFSLPPAFSAPADGLELWEELEVRPEIKEELVGRRVLPSTWHAWLGDPCRSQLTALQTSGSGDCLLNALSLGALGVQDRTPPLARGDMVVAFLAGKARRCVVAGREADGSAVSVVPILDYQASWGGDRGEVCDLNELAALTAAGPILLPMSLVEGEGEPDAAEVAAVAGGAAGGCNPGEHGGAALGRDHAALRLLLSLAMRESEDAVFVRWARERLSDGGGDAVRADDDSGAPFGPSGGDGDGGGGASLAATPAPGAVAAVGPGAGAGAAPVGSSGDLPSPTESATSSGAESGGGGGGGVDSFMAANETDGAAAGPLAAGPLASPLAAVPSATATAKADAGAGAGAGASAAALVAAAEEEAMAASFRLRDEWRASCDDASTPKRSLLPEHIWVLAQLLRRPILCYGPRYEGYPWTITHSGIYLPSLHPAALCHKNPLVLLYTAGHFSAGVFRLPPASQGVAARAAVAVAAEDHQPQRIANLDRAEMAKTMAAAEVTLEQYLAVRGLSKFLDAIVAHGIKTAAEVVDKNLLPNEDLVGSLRMTPTDIAALYGAPTASTAPFLDGGSGDDAVRFPVFEDEVRSLWAAAVAMRTQRPKPPTPPTSSSSSSSLSSASAFQATSASDIQRAIDASLLSLGGEDAQGFASVPIVRSRTMDENEALAKAIAASLNAPGDTAGGSFAPVPLARSRTMDENEALAKAIAASLNASASPASSPGSSRAPPVVRSRSQDDSDALARAIAESLVEVGLAAASSAGVGDSVAFADNFGEEEAEETKGGGGGVSDGRPFRGGGADGGHDDMDDDEAPPQEEVADPRGGADGASASAPDVVAAPAAAIAAAPAASSPLNRGAASTATFVVSTTRTETATGSHVISVVTGAASASGELPAATAKGGSTPGAGAAEDGAATGACAVPPALHEDTVAFLAAFLEAWARSAGASSGAPLEQRLNQAPLGGASRPVPAASATAAGPPAPNPWPVAAAVKAAAAAAGSASPPPPAPTATPGGVATAPDGLPGFNLNAQARAAAPSRPAPASILNFNLDLAGLGLVGRRQQAATSSNGSGAGTLVSSDSALDAAIAASLGFAGPAASGSDMPHIDFGGAQSADSEVERAIAASLGDTAAGSGSNGGGGASAGRLVAGRHRSLSELDLPAFAAGGGGGARSLGRQGGDAAPLGDWDARLARLRAAAGACRHQLRAGVGAAPPLRRTRGSYFVRTVPSALPPAAGSFPPGGGEALPGLFGPRDAEFRRWTWRPCWVTLTPFLAGAPAAQPGEAAAAGSSSRGRSAAAPPAEQRPSLVCSEDRAGSDGAGRELFRLDLATLVARAPPGLAHWRGGVAVVCLLPAPPGAAAGREPRQELWLRCKASGATPSTTEADAWRHALVDRQRIAQLALQPLPPAAIPQRASPRAGGDGGCGGGGNGNDNGNDDVVGWSLAGGAAGWLPLVDHDGAALRLRFASAGEAIDEARLLAAYLDCAAVPGPAAAKGHAAAAATLCCRQRVGAAHAASVSVDFVRQYLSLRRTYDARPGPPAGSC